MSLSRALALLLVVTLLAACGFRPLYGGREGAATAAALSQIHVAPIEERIGQELRNALIDGLAPEGQAHEMRYRLSIDVDTRRQRLLIQLDDTATRFNLFMTASFVLTEVATGVSIYSDSVRLKGSYNVVPSDFATLAAEQDAEKRVAREASEEIRTLLAIFFAQAG